MSAKTRKGVPYVRRRGGAASKTGRVGVTPLTRKFKRAGGAVVVRRYFVAELMVDGRPRRREFCINTRGHDAAYRAAVRCREGWEREVEIARLAAEPHRQAADKRYGKNWRAGRPGHHQGYMRRYKADPAKLAALRAREAEYRQRPAVVQRRRQLRALKRACAVKEGI